MGCDPSDLHLLPPLPETLWTRAAAIAAMAVPAGVLRAKGFEFATYSGATRLPKDLRSEPPSLQSLFRAHVRLRMRHALEEIWPDKVLDTQRPELIVEARPDREDVVLVLRSLYVLGRYRKLARGISQTVFHCPGCRGKRTRRDGCGKCEGTGRLVPEAVDEFVIPAVRNPLDARRGAFHGSGREDVDVLMLGEGRPFVVSLEDPRLRTLDPAGIAAEVKRRSGGRVEVCDLEVIDRPRARLVMTARSDKLYRVRIETTAGHELPPDAATLLRGLTETDLEQRTPVRVSGRRADRVRRRRIIGLDVVAVDRRSATIEVRTEAGTYVKEFVSGDEGRTVPSVSSVLGAPCVCVELDVLAVGSVSQESLR